MSGSAGSRRSARTGLHGAIERDIANGVHHGAVILLARGGEILHHDAIGTVDADGSRPAELDDRFWLASTSKSMTAVAALKLIDAGRLTFGTRVADVIPEFGVRGKRRVTIYHLLTHTAGTWSGFVPPPPLQWGEGVRDLAAVVAAVGAQPATGRPGEHVVYNPSADFSVLGQIIHLIDGRPFAEVLAREIFEPLQMEATSFGLEVDHPKRIPIAMSDLNDGAAAVEVMHSLNYLIDETAERPGGGAFATAHDVFRFAEMLRVGGALDDVRILSPAIADYALQNHTGSKPNQFWDFSKEDRMIDQFPANFSLCGGYVRGHGNHHLTPFGSLASPSTFGAVGSGSTMWMVEPQRELTFVFLSAGLMEGLGHFQRLQRLGDLAIAAAGA